LTEFTDYTIPYTRGREFLIEIKSSADLAADKAAAKDKEPNEWLSSEFAALPEKYELKSGDNVKFEYWGRNPDSGEVIENIDIEWTGPLGSFLSKNMAINNF
jgi:hypothetical protein